MPFSTRCQRLQHSLAAQQLAGFLCCNAANIAYLTGFRGDAGWLMVTADHVLLYTDGRFETQAKEELQVGEARIIAEDVLGAVAALVTERQLSPVGFESHSLSFASYQKLSERLASSALRPVEHLIENHRLTKEPGELTLIRRALRLTEAALHQVLPQLQIGVSEIEVAAELQHTMRRLGAEKAAFETIVAFGERAALPHARPSARQLHPGDVVLIDTGAVAEGYCADITRTFFSGEPITPARDAYQAVLAAQEAGLRELRAGLPCRQAHEAARQALDRHGLAEAFKHSLGHGVGIEVQEGPRLSQKSQDQVAPGMVVTIEPGVYVEGQFGIRVEDMAVVTEQGPKLLTTYAKSLEEMVLTP